MIIIFYILIFFLCIGAIGWFTSVVSYKFQNAQSNLSFITYASAAVLAVIYNSWLIILAGFLVGLVIRIIYDKTADRELKKRKKQNVKI